MKWIQAHAAYDDLHPVEALDIIYSLLGDAPAVRDIQQVKGAILKSYDLYQFGHRHKNGRFRLTCGGRDVARNSIRLFDCSILCIDCDLHSRIHVPKRLS